MDSVDFMNIVCRICLDENVSLDWNSELIEHGGVTYKDCYYKYTQLEQLDDDPLSFMLCKNCSDSLEDAHLLFLKALDSYNFLLKVNTKNDSENSTILEDLTYCSSTDFETVLVEKLEPGSEMLLEHYEDEYSIKSEDDKSDKVDDDMQYEDIMEVEVEQEGFDNQYIEDNNVEEDSWNVYESARKKPKRLISHKRKGREDEENSDTQIDYKKSRTSYTRRNRISQSTKMEKTSIDAVCRKSEDENFINLPDVEEFEYSELLYDEDDKAEYETSQETEMYNTDEEISTKKQSNRVTSTSMINTPNKKDPKSKFLKLENEENENKTKNSRETKKPRTKAKTPNSQNTPSMCSYCSKILHNKYALKKHEKTHLARERNAPCPICGVKFLEESYVKIHMQIHNQNRVKKHQCEFCEKAFYEKGSLNVHRRIHLGKMIPCPICSKEFFRQVDVDIHMNSHSAVSINAETKKRSRYWVRCKYCNKDIMSTSFKYHTAVHLNEPQMKCSICDREFFRRDSCTEHLKNIHKKTTEEYNSFIILYNKNRLSHLYLEQTTELKK